MARDFDRYQRWRLILGPRGGAALGDGTLTPEMVAMDDALGAVYDADEGPGGDGGEGRGGGRRGAGLGSGKGRLAGWLGDIRKYFDEDVVALVQQDAIERKGLKQLLFEPEALGEVAPSVELVGALLALKDLIPEEARASARAVVASVVDEIVRRLKPALEQAVRGGLRRSGRGGAAVAANIDWRRTLRANLKNYVPARRVVIPERFYFHARQRRRREWTVIVALDQSGSMAESVVYGAVTGAIFASLPALETRVVAFDVEVADLSDRYDDPVDLLFGVQLGGGTNINRAVKYCESLVHDPKKTLFVLITDLNEGGNARELVRRMAALVDAGVRALCLLALSDGGVPAYDANLARRLREAGVACFGCTPRALPEVLEAALAGDDLAAVARRVGAVV